MNEAPAEAIEKKQYIDANGRVYPEGIPPYEVSVSGVVWPEFVEGQTKSFVLDASINSIDYEFMLEPYKPEDDPAPEGYAFSKIFARVPDSRSEDSEEEQAWKLVDVHALIPSDHNRERLLKVFEALVANPDDPEEKQKGIRSHKLLAYVGGAAVAAGVVIGIKRGIRVYRHKHPKS